MTDINLMTMTLAELQELQCKVATEIHHRVLGDARVGVGGQATRNGGWARASSYAQCLFLPSPSQCVLLGWLG